MENIKYVEIDDILRCREERVYKQNEFIKKYNCPVISFCMNIPGPIKTNKNILNAFEEGIKNIFKVLEKNNIKILDKFEIHNFTGDEIILSIRENAEKIKDLMIKIEEEHKLGRIFDIDVIDINGEKISRKKFRKCFICDKQAQECARSRKHSVEEMFEKIQELIEKNL